MKTSRKLIAAAALCALGLSSAFAQGTTFTNGSFDGGSLLNWTTEGDVLVVGSRKAVAMTTASFEFEDDAPLEAGANNLSGVSPVDFSFAPTLANLPVESFDIGGVGTEGSAIRQEFYATAGNQLTVNFSWTFLSAEKTQGVIQAQPDFGFLAINGTVVKFIDALSAPAVSTFIGTFGDFSEGNVAWGWDDDSYTYTPTTDGLVTLALGVVDIGDYSYTSELRVDNISVSAITPVPEPESYAMLLAGLAFMGGIARRRGNRA